MTPRGASRRRGRPVLAALASLAALAVLAASGCGLPTGTSAVREGLDIAQVQGRPIGVIYPTPAAGETPDQIVRGFLRAGRASDGVYDAARAFLDAATARTWSPEGEIVVLRAGAQPEVSAAAGDRVAVTGQVAAVIDAAGRFTPQPEGTTRRLQLRLARVGGEWRISELPAAFGRWITAEDLRRLVQPFAVHYIATDRRALVPDVRWFPLNALATRLARAQLAPPPPDLAGSVREDIPVGTQLIADAVSVESGLATVNLTGPAMATTEARQNVWAQLVSTLRQDPRVSAVAVQIEGSSLEVPQAVIPARSIADVGFVVPDPVVMGAPLVRVGTRVSRYLADQNPVGGDPEAATGFPSVPTAYQWLAVAADASELAAVNGDQLTRWVGPTRHDVPAFATGLGHPAYDRRGYLWVGGAGRGAQAGTRLWTVATPAAEGGEGTAGETRAEPIVAPWLAGRLVLESRVSPDGQRVAVLSTGSAGGTARIDLAGVVRDGGGHPRSLAEPRRMGVLVTNPTGLAWVDSTTLATLGDRAGAGRRPWLLNLNGEESELTPTPAGQRITTLGGERNLLVITDRGTLLVRAGRTWQSAGTVVDLAPPAG